MKKKIHTEQMPICCFVAEVDGTREVTQWELTQIHARGTAEISAEFPWAVVTKKLT